MTKSRRILSLPAVTSAVMLLLAVSVAQGSSPATPQAGATGGSGATGSGGTATPLTATLSACHADATPANRYAIFASETVAGAARGTVAMSVDFELQERSAAGGFVIVPAPGFGSWVTSERGIGIFSYSHEVTALPAPAAFRVLVRARWVGRGHRVLRRLDELSPVCVQPLLEPDLAITSISRGAARSGGAVTWNVAVRNVGSAPAGQFQVSLTVGGSALAPVSVPGLGVGAAQVVQFSGPRCTAGGTLVALADSGGALTEPADSLRSRTIDCPA